VCRLTSRCAADQQQTATAAVLQIMLVCSTWYKHELLLGTSPGIN
jgi:hypothetical protein